MTRQFDLRKSLLHLVFLMSITVVANAVPPTGCDDITPSGQPRIPANSTVELFFDRERGAAPNQDYIDALNAAVTELSGEVDGIQLRVVESEGPLPSIAVQMMPGIQNAATTDDVADYRGLPISSTNSNFSTGVIRVFPAQSGGECGGLCLDPSKLYYKEALKRVFMHEIMHGLGRGIRTKPT